MISSPMQKPGRRLRLTVVGGAGSGSRSGPSTCMHTGSEEERHGLFIRLLDRGAAGFPSDLGSGSGKWQWACGIMDVINHPTTE